MKPCWPGNATFANAQQVIDLLVGKLYQSAEKTTKNRYLKLPQPQPDPFTLASTGQSKELG